MWKRELQALLVNVLTVLIFLSSFNKEGPFLEQARKEDSLWPLGVVGFEEKSKRVMPSEQHSKTVSRQAAADLPVPENDSSEKHQIERAASVETKGFETVFEKGDYGQIAMKLLMSVKQVRILQELIDRKMIGTEDQDLYELSYDINKMMRYRRMVHSSNGDAYYNALEPEARDNIIFYEAVLSKRGEERAADDIFAIYERLLTMKKANENVAEVDDEKAQIKEEFLQAFSENGISDKETLSALAVMLDQDQQLYENNNIDAIQDIYTVPYVIGEESRENMMLAAMCLVGKVRYVWGGGHSGASYIKGINPVWKQWEELYPSEPTSEVTLNTVSNDSPSRNHSSASTVSNNSEIAEDLKTVSNNTETTKKQRAVSENSVTIKGQKTASENSGTAGGLRTASGNSGVTEGLRTASENSGATDDDLRTASGNSGVTADSRTASENSNIKKDSDAAHEAVRTKTVKNEGFGTCIKPSGTWCPIHGESHTSFHGESIDSLDDYIKIRSNLFKSIDLTDDKYRKMLSTVIYDGGVNAHVLDGLDCSGFTSWVFNQISNRYKVNTAARFFTGQSCFKELELGQDLLPGDIFAWQTHIVMIVGKVRDGSKAYVTIEETPNVLKFGAAYYSDASASDLAKAKQIAAEANLLIGGLKASFEAPHVYCINTVGETRVKLEKEKSKSSSKNAINPSVNQEAEEAEEGAEVPKDKVRRAKKKENPDYYTVVDGVRYKVVSAYMPRGYTGSEASLGIPAEGTYDFKKVIETKDGFSGQYYIAVEDEADESLENGYQEPAEPVNSSENTLNGTSGTEESIVSPEAAEEVPAEDEVLLLEDGYEDDGSGYIIKRIFMPRGYTGSDASLGIPEEGTYDHKDVVEKEEGFYGTYYIKKRYAPNDRILEEETMPGYAVINTMKIARFKDGFIDEGLPLGDTGIPIEEMDAYSIISHVVTKLPISYISGYDIYRGELWPSAEERAVEAVSSNLISGSEQEESADEVFLDTSGIENDEIEAVSVNDLPKHMKRPDVYS
ncbi:MAG: hypothetical protein J6P05_06020 [Lachnospiraceae bacterium]|nr:hypothetical protein [Lachnospiraceae bacterium]